MFDQQEAGWDSQTPPGMNGWGARTRFLSGLHTEPPPTTPDYTEASYVHCTNTHPRATRRENIAIIETRKHDQSHGVLRPRPCGRGCQAWSSGLFAIFVPCRCGMSMAGLAQDSWLCDHLAFALGCRHVSWGLLVMCNGRGSKKNVAADGGIGEGGGVRAKSWRLGCPERTLGGSTWNVATELLLEQG